ncbi:MAG TPA: AAA family ATPase, partial [Polyangiaceae bacterium]|nr:AAA family ATPase [Polyangiaceae bacterium]
MADVDIQRFEAAGARFVLFFNELGRAFVEREELLAQVALALLSREHVLMTGPPGTAKSGVASAVLRRVIDEKTGQPSLFARQFTESTVQTDLVGPINFKTLMETGRTEHFTDEGMLGAVHAFLDEVFDGRDMLLRSTLNVLQERELKQGTKTTRGAIECALMTTNRYLAEVLESSRETLLAFVDRVAFVSFVPKGFATTVNLSNVLRKQVGGTGTPRLTEALTIQDLDALQAATESVYVPDAICDSLAELLGMLDDELGAAERADPQFLATRYLSTRTAVRSGRILRAVCVYDKLFFDKDRALEVNQGDLKALRLSILLGGPVPESLAALVSRETDPRERRQLSIIRTEREVFERCLAKLK